MCPRHWRRHSDAVMIRIYSVWDSERQRGLNISHRSERPMRGEAASRTHSQRGRPGFAEGPQDWTRQEAGGLWWGFLKMMGVQGVEKHQGALQVPGKTMSNHIRDREVNTKLRRWRSVPYTEGLPWGRRVTYSGHSIERQAPVDCAGCSKQDGQGEGTALLHGRPGRERGPTSHFGRGRPGVQAEGSI